MLHAEHATHVWSSWGGDPSSVAGVMLLGGVYVAGVRRAWTRAGRGHGVRRWQCGAYAAGMLVLAVALLSPIDALSESLFAAHMLQHILLAVVAPPLLVLGAPMVAALWTLPDGTRRRVAFAVARTHTLVRVWRAITAPLSAAAIHMVVLWTWHAPSLYDAALRNAFVHFLEHASFVASAALMWWGILRPRWSRRSAYGLGIGVLFLTAMQSGALGALLTLSHRLWYPVQHANAGTFGLSPLEDQQLAGLIMWVPGGLWYLACMAGLVAAWMRELGRAVEPNPQMPNIRLTVRQVRDVVA